MAVNTVNKAGVKALVKTLNPRNMPPHTYSAILDLHRATDISE